ncbi:hypothetical protein J437_LFUL011538, partial [Ladona fulva]
MEAKLFETMAIQYYKNTQVMNIYCAVLVVIVVSLVNTPTGCDSSVTESPCDDQWQCLSNLQNQSSCPEGTIFQERMTVGGCCPACVKFLTVNESCEEPGSYFETPSLQFIQKDEILDSKECAPGLACQMTDVTEGFSCQPVIGEFF